MKKILVKAGTFLLAFVCLFSLIACEKKGNTSDEENSGKDKTGTEYYVKYNQVKIELGKDATAVLSALGAPKERKELGACGGLGSQIRYSYPSVVIYTLEKDGKETIDQITLLDDMVSTPKGISIGSSANDAKTAYGKPDVEDSSSMQFKKGELVLKFRVESEKITGIDYMRNLQ